MTDIIPKIIENVDMTVVGQMGNANNAGILSESIDIKLHMEGAIKNVANLALCQVIW